jgi:hypothetical protein
MSPDQFLYCRICHEVHHGAPFDSAPYLRSARDDCAGIFIDDRRQFIDRRFDHKLIL